MASALWRNLPLVKHKFFNRIFLKTNAACGFLVLG